jgi:chorismate--pyruvate lyase
LRQLGVFRLRVLAEYGQAASMEEARPMGLRPGALVWVREVMMSIDGDDCVVARSLTPLAASRSTWQGMRRLRTRPLADMLYHDRTVRRSAFECRRLARGVPFYRTLKQPQRAAGVLARRSVFWRNGMPLLVAEGFLPAFWDKAEKRRPL